MKLARRYGVVAALAAAIAVVNPALARGPADSPTGVAPPAPGTVVLSGLTPTTVLGHQATLLGPRDPTAPLSINIGLPLRNQAALDAFIANQASHGVYLTQYQFNAQFGVTPKQVQAVDAWGAAYGLKPSFASGDGTLITLQGTTAAVQAALNVTINNYREKDGATFFANATDPSVPAALGVLSVDGLNSIPRFRTMSRAALRAQLKAAALRPGGYFPSDFRTAYDLAGHGYDGTGQAIGLTLWGAPVPNSDLAGFAAASGEPPMSGAVTTTPSGSGADTIDWVFTNGTDTTTDAQVETAMDVEYSHGMAPHAHLVYFLGDQVGFCPFSCGGSEVGLENAISMAANNTIGIHAVSNSWGGGEAPSATDPFTSMTTSSFQHAVAVGITFYFSSGDFGTDTGGLGMASYPADSPFVVAVGGTTLNTNADFSYASESAWNGGGAGCSAVFARPTWQAGISSPGCTMRAEPDVSADADLATGADVFFNNTAPGPGCPAGHVNCQVGGTSLSAPLWTGMAAVADAYAAAIGGPQLGWAAPKIYANGLNGMHDVTTGCISGTIRLCAATGWDQATGWGSPDWWRWVQALIGSPPPPPPPPTPLPPPPPSIGAVWGCTGLCIGGSGFTRGGLLQLRVTGLSTVYRSVRTDSTGAFTLSFFLPTNTCSFRTFVGLRAIDLTTQQVADATVGCPSGIPT